MLINFRIICDFFPHPVRRPGIQGLHSDILKTGGSERGSFFLPKKSQLQNFSTQKIPYFLAYPKNPTFKAVNCAYVIVNYCWFELMKKAIPKKSLCFLQPQKILASFIDPKNSLLSKISDSKNPSDHPINKIYEWGPWAIIFCEIQHDLFKRTNFEFLKEKKMNSAMPRIV